MGFTPSETATFIFSLRQPLSGKLQKDLASNPKQLIAELTTLSELIDKLGLHTVEVLPAIARGGDLPGSRWRCWSFPPRW